MQGQMKNVRLLGPSVRVACDHQQEVAAGRRALHMDSGRRGAGLQGLRQGQVAANSGMLCMIEDVEQK